MLYGVRTVKVTGGGREIEREREREREREKREREREREEREKRERERERSCHKQGHYHRKETELIPQSTLRKKHTPFADIPSIIL